MKLITSKGDGTIKKVLMFLFLIMTYYFTLTNQIQLSNHYEKTKTVNKDENDLLRFKSLNLNSNSKSSTANTLSNNKLVSSEQIIKVIYLFL